MEELNIFDDNTRSDSESSDPEIVENNKINMCNNEIAENVAGNADSDNEPIEFDGYVDNNGWTRIGCERPMFEFIGDSGVKIERTNTPLDIFFQFFDDEIVEYIVQHTNLYAAQY